MFKSRQRIFLLSLLFLLFCITITGCNKSTSGARNANDRFEQFTEQMFQSELTSNTLNLHYTLANPEDYGITEYEVTLGTYSKQAELASYSAAENYKSVLESFPYHKLSEENQITYDILLYSLEMQLASGNYNLFDEPLSPTIGTQAQLPVLLAEYTFYTKDDMENYIMLLNELPDFYSSTISFEKRKAQAGLFMADYAADDIIKQCREFIQNPETNYLIEIFDEKIDASTELTDAEKEDLKTRNKDAVLTSVIPAYEIIISGLSELKGQGTNEKGLCYYENGKEYYEHLVKRSTGSSRSIDELKALIQNQMDQDILIMSQVLVEDAAVIDIMDTYDFTLTDPTEILNILTEQIAEDFPVPPDVNFEVKYVHKSLEEHLSPAFYLVPPLDDMENNVIYINGASNYDKIDLFTTLAHEGYPGHLYQTIYSNQASTNNIRSILNFSGYTEGWATYVEMYSYSLSGLDENLAALLQVNNSYILSLYANIDIGIHYDGWDMADTAEYLAEFGISGDDLVQEIYYSMVEEPANYLKYYIGYVEFLQLKNEAEEARGNDFVLKDFHEEVLTIGPASFDTLRKYILEQ